MKCSVREVLAYFTSQMDPKALLFPVFFVMFGYAFLGYMAAGFGSVGDGLRAMLAFQMLAFPLYFLVFVSLRLAVYVLWLYVGSSIFLMVSYGCPPGRHLSCLLSVVPVQEELILAVIWTHAVYLLKKHQRTIARWMRGKIG